MSEPSLITQQFDELKLTGKLPSPTGAGLAILRLTQGDDFCMGDLAKVIQSDPSLTSRILRVANSCRHGSAEPARTVTDAAMRMGVRAVRTVAFGFSLISNEQSGSCEEFDYEGFWSVSLARAVAAQVVSERFPSLVREEAFTCGLLAGIGRLALASVHPEEYGRVLRKTRNGGDLRSIEQEAFGLNHSRLSAVMLEDWKLPREYYEAVEAFEATEADSVELSGQSRRMVEVLRAAKCIGSVCAGDGADTERDGEQAKKLEDLRAGLEMPPEEFYALCDRVSDSWQEWGAMLNVSTRKVEPFEVLAKRTALVERTHDTGSVAQDTKRLTVLVVDDDRLAQRGLVHRLRREGHDVFTASDGEEGLAVALSRDPDLILTDAVMPKMDGIQMVKALRRTDSGKRIFILVLTSEGQEQLAVTAFDAGADDYVTKPYNPKVLMARIRAGQRLVELRAQVEEDRKYRTRQVADMAVLNRKLRSAALNDALTCLPNRRFATPCLQREIELSQTNGQEVSVIMIDIDHFKRVNDEHGHDVGDQVLKATAQALRGSMRKQDVVCRVGGEEFLVICRESSVADAAASAERVRAAVEANVISFGTFNRSVTLSLGVAELSEVDGTMDGILRLADERVYIAKGAGRNQVRASGGGGSRSNVA